MASNDGVDDLNEKFGELLLVKCRICHEKKVGRTPRGLKCQHSFCDECLKKHHATGERGGVCCPICRKRTTLKTGGVSELPVDFKAGEAEDMAVAFFAELEKVKTKEEEEAPFQILVNTATGKTIVLKVKPSDSVEKLKTLIGEREGLEADAMYLVYGGKPMVDGHTIGEYDLKPNCHVQAAGRSYGGREDSTCNSRRVSA